MLYQNDTVKIDKIKYDQNIALKGKVLSKVIENNLKPNVLETFIKGGSCSFFNEDYSGKKLFLWEEFREFIDFLKPHIRNYLKNINMSEDDYYVTGMWSNRYPPGTFVNRHIHSYRFTEELQSITPTQNDMLGILLYLQKPENSGNLVVEIPNGDTSYEYEVPMSEGDVVIFQNTLYHWTIPNKSNEDKFVIGIEMCQRHIMNEKTTEYGIEQKTLEEL